MRLDPVSGWMDGVRRAPSPNCDDRPDGSEVEALIVHSISLPPGCFGGPEIEEFFLNRLDAGRHPYFHEIRDLRVSAHFLVRRHGAIVQFVPTTLRAWHAGVSHCLGRDRVNDFSLGVELEGCDDVPFDERQYAALAALADELFAHYSSLGVERMFAHSDIAPGRKTDPGPLFDWHELRRRIA